jgi:hypothetical protein
MGNCCSSAPHDDSSLHRAAENQVSQPQAILPISRTATIERIPPSLAYQTEREIPDDQRSERGSVRSRRSARSQRSQTAPAKYQRTRSQSEQAASRPELFTNVPVPPLPPTIRPRAATGISSAHHAPGSRNETPLVDRTPALPPPRSKRKSAPDESSHRQLTPTVRSTLSDNFRYVSNTLP